MPTDSKTIAAYNTYADAWLKHKHDGSSIFHTHLEKPAIYGLLPPLEGKAVLCAGCGSGEEVEFIKSLGAVKVVGIDISEKLIDIARTTYPGIEYKVMDIEHLDFPAGLFDLVFSSLTMHYLNDWVSALLSVSRVLKENGIFLFSMTHPFFSAMAKTDTPETKSRIHGYSEDKKSNTLTLYGDYLENHEVTVSVTKDLTVTNYHRSLATVFRDMKTTGFELLDMVEPKALDESKQDNPHFWEIHQKVPEFLILKTQKKPLLQMGLD